MVLSAEGCAGLGGAERAGTLGSAVPVRGDVAGRHGDGCLSFVRGRGWNSVYQSVRPDSQATETGYRTVGRPGWRFCVVMCIHECSCSPSCPQRRVRSRVRRATVSRRAGDAGLSSARRGGWHEQEAGAIRRRHRNISRYKEGKRSGDKGVEERTVLWW
jgi:hypothetical protein